MPAVSKRDRRIIRVVPNFTISLLINSVIWSIELAI